MKYKNAGERYKGRDDRLQLLAYNLLYPVNDNTGFIMPETNENSGLNFKELNVNGSSSEKMYGVVIPIGNEPDINDIRDVFS